MIIQDKLTILISVLVIVLCLIFNPLYILILLALISKYKTLPKFLNYIIAASLILSFTNREIGEGWYADSGFRAQDDALNYIKYYTDLEKYGLLSTINFSEGKEPLWITLAYLTGILTSWSATALVLVSTGVPIVLMHKSFNNLSPNFALNTVFFYAFFPEIFHTYYHLWRFSLSLSILAILVTTLISRQKEVIRIRKLIIPALSHLSALLPITWIVLIKWLPQKIKKNWLIYVLSLILTSLLIVTLSTYVLGQINFEKFNFYIETANASLDFRYSSRHFVYILFSLLLIFFSRKKFTVGLSLLSLGILIIPAFLSFVPIFYERIILTTTPILILLFIREVPFRSRIESSAILLISVLLLIRNSYILDQTLFYKFLANGRFYKPFNGILFNLYDIL